MFGFLFGWRNASKCKRLLQQAQCRLKLLHHKTVSIVRQLRHDVALLLQLPDHQRALNRAEQLFKDENILAVYRLLDHFCEFLIIHIPYIRRHRELPNDINEAVSSLVFASARCGDIPELPDIRHLFGQRYGQRFLATALHLLPGNLVNPQIKEKLSAIPVSDDVKLKLVDEISREHRLRPEVLALEYTPEFHEKKVDDANKTIAKLPEQDVEEKQGSAGQMDGHGEAALKKFTITDLDIIQESEETKSVQTTCDRRKAGIRSEAWEVESLSQISDEEEEARLAEDERVVRIRTREEGGLEEDEGLPEKRSMKSGRRRRRRSRASWENMMMMEDMECCKYYHHRGAPGNRYRYKERKHGEEEHWVKPCCIVYNVFTYPEQYEGAGVVEVKKEASSGGSNSKPRNVNMGIPKHVHPKLPDYDDIAAKFTALRRLHLPSSPFSSI